MNLTPDLDEEFHKRTADLWGLFCVWLISCNDHMSLAVRKKFLEIYGHVTTTIERSMYLVTFTSLDKIVFLVLSLFLDNKNIGK